jgi:hypothetical protein
MRALLKSFRWKRLLVGLGLLWLFLGGIAYELYPWAPTGHRLLDAALASAVATVVLMELLELLGVLWRFPRLLSGEGSGDRD